MRRILIAAALSALVLAKPEMYKETEDFQYSRSSTDEGSKSGFYGAQRGNMGGNFEKAHNMDGLAQHQMSGLVRQIDGELGDGYKTKTGSVYTAANSRGVYGSGKFDLGNLQGRNFEETESFGGGLSHSSRMMQNAGFRDQSAMNSGAYSSSRSHSTGYQRYQTGGLSRQFVQANNLQSADQQQLVDNLQSADRLHSAHGYDYGSQTGQFSNAGFQSQHGYDQSNANSGYSDTYGSNTRIRTLNGAPVRIVVRPGTRVTVPLTAQTYDANQAALTSDQSNVNTDTELLSADGQKINNIGVSGPKHYESSYRYHKKWEKHDTQPIAVDTVPTVNPFPAQSELLGQAEHLDDTQQRNVNSFDSRTNNRAHAASTKSQASSQSRYQAGYNAQQSISSSLIANGYDANSHAPKANFAANGAQGSSSVLSANGYNTNSHTANVDLEANSAQSNRAAFTAHGYNTNSHASNANFEANADLAANSAQRSRSALTASGYNTNSHGSNGNFAANSADSSNLDGLLNTKPKSYQSSYSYHKAWERQGDPYVILPAGGTPDGQMSQKLTAASLNQGAYSSPRYGSQYNQAHQSFSQHGVDCDEDGHVRMTRSYDPNQEQQFDLYQNFNHDQEETGHQAPLRLENLEYLGQQLQTKWDNLQDLGQQAQDYWDSSHLEQQNQHSWDNLQNLGQQTQEKFDNLEDLGQETEKNFDKLENFGQQSQSQWDQQDLGQQTQEKFDKLEDLGQQSQGQWDQLQTLGQQEQEKLDKPKYLQQESQNPWNKLQDLGQQTQEKFDKLEDLGQVNNKWDKLEDLGQQQQTSWDNTQQQSQDSWGQQSEHSHQTQSNLEQEIQHHGFEEHKEQNLDNSFWAHSTDQKYKSYESSFASNTESKKYNTDSYNKFESTPQWPINGNSGVSRNDEYNQTNNQQTQTEPNSEIQTSLGSLWDKIDSIAQKTLKDEDDDDDDDDNVNQDSKNQEPTTWPHSQDNNVIPMTYLPHNAEDNHKIPTTTESDLSPKVNGAQPRDIGRGDIGPEDIDSTSDTSDISHIEQSYKTPKEIEALSFTQKSNDTSSYFDKQKQSADTSSHTVLGLYNKKFLEDTLKLVGQDVNTYTTTTKKSINHSSNNDFSITQTSTKHNLPELYKDTETLLEEQQNMDQSFDVLDQQTQEASLINELTQQLTSPEEQFQIFDQQTSSTTHANKINLIFQKHNYADTLLDEQQNQEQQFDDFDQQAQEIQKSELTDFNKQMQSTWQLGENLHKTHNHEDQSSTASIFTQHNSPQEQYYQNINQFSEEPVLPLLSISKHLEKQEEVQMKENQLPPTIEDVLNNHNNISSPSEPVAQTEKPGFWKSIGSKLSNAKSKVYSWFGSE